MTSVTSLCAASNLVVEGLTKHVCSPRKRCHDQGKCGQRFCLLAQPLKPCRPSNCMSKLINMSPLNHVAYVWVFLMCLCNNAPAGPTLQASLPASLVYTPPSHAEVRAVQTHWDNACQCSLRADCNHGNVSIWSEASCTLKESWCLKTNRWVGNNVMNAIVALLNTRQTELRLHKHDPAFFLNSCFYSLLQG